MSFDSRTGRTSPDGTSYRLGRDSDVSHLQPTRSRRVQCSQRLSTATSRLLAQWDAAP